MHRSVACIKTPRRVLCRFTILDYEIPSGFSNICATLHVTVPELLGEALALVCTELLPWAVRTVLVQLVGPPVRLGVSVLFNLMTIIL